MNLHHPFFSHFLEKRFRCFPGCLIPCMNHSLFQVVKGRKIPITTGYIKSVHCNATVYLYRTSNPLSILSHNPGRYFYGTRCSLSGVRRCVYHSRRPVSVFSNDCVLRCHCHIDHLPESYSCCHYGTFPCYVNPLLATFTAQVENYSEFCDNPTLLFPLTKWRGQFSPAQDRLRDTGTPV